MKPTPGAAKVLVASDNSDDAHQILRQLKGDFDHVRLSTDPGLAVQDFERFMPDVLVLAFDSLDKAQRYYLGLYRLGQALHQHAHRTVILCTKDEVHAVFDLCKKEYFDDYVLYWPHTHDGPRLAMSIWMACREMTTMHSSALQPAELLAHARHLVDLEKTLEREFAAGEQHAATAASRAQLQVEKDIVGAIDEFSLRLVRGSAAGWVDVKDPNHLAREIDQLKDQQIIETRRASANAGDPMSAWARKFKDQIEPALAGARVLSEKVRTTRLIVMAVDDDEFVRQSVKNALDPLKYDLRLAGDGISAMGQLRRARPDVILMDIKLPGQDGLALTEQLKSAPHLAAIPIIMMTGDARRETLVSSMKVGAAAFLVKPFSRESLTAKLDKVMAL